MLLVMEHIETKLFPSHWYKLIIGMYRHRRRWYLYTSKCSRRLKAFNLYCGILFGMYCHKTHFKILRSIEINWKRPFSGCRTHDFRSVAYALSYCATLLDIKIMKENKHRMKLDFISKSIIMQVSYASSLYEQKVFFKYVTNLFKLCFVKMIIPEKIRIIFNKQWPQIGHTKVSVSFSCHETQNITEMLSKGTCSLLNWC